MRRPSLTLRSLQTRAVAVGAAVAEEGALPAAAGAVVLVRIEGEAAAVPVETTPAAVGVAEASIRWQ
jgi:hypothetical protein